MILYTALLQRNSFNSSVLDSSLITYFAQTTLGLPRCFNSSVLDSRVKKELNEPAYHVSFNSSVLDSHVVHVLRSHKNDYWKTRFNSSVLDS